MVSKMSISFWIIKTALSIIFISISVMFSMLSIFTRDLNFIVFYHLPFLELNSAQFSFDIYIDWKLLMMISIVSFITGNILIFSKSYMKLDLYKIRFIFILSTFALSMLWTVMTSKNIASMLVGWDFLGLTSLLLIMHYQSNYVYNNSMITFIINRLGDIAFIMSIAFMFPAGSWSMMSNNEYSNYILIMLSIAAFTKSAQFPFCVWLPKAMAAPTPVSALVHSSTLVTAGVILLIQLEPIIYDSSIKNYLFCISVFTMFISSLAGCSSYDIKKIIAFSTMSQISFMMIALILGGIEVAFFHLMIHALFKSLMFLTAGSIIHHTAGEQDIRLIKNVKNSLPLESITMMISILALVGFPFMSGFFSKDLIIEYYSNSLYSYILIFIMDLSICLTTFYSFRLVKNILTNNYYYNSLLSWNSSWEEKMTMLVFFFPLIMSGSVISWLYIKHLGLELPMPFFKKSFGLWALIMSMLIMSMYWNKKINTNLTWIYFQSIGLIDYLIILLNKMSINLSNLYLLYIENMWNKFISIELFYSWKKYWKYNTKFNSWMLLNLVAWMFLFSMFWSFMWF